MNDKFFDLKKEKQDRIINAAFKIFAKNGYAHASTDDIVREAEISKGLLFHYFTNKIGLYSFIFDFGVKFYIVELTSTVDRNDNDFFGLHLQIKNVDSRVMKNYPYLLAFLNSVKDEEVIEALQATSENKKAVAEKKDEYFKRAYTQSFKPEVDIDRLNQLIEFASNSVLRECLRKDDPDSEAYYEEMKQYLIFLRELAYK